MKSLVAALVLGLAGCSANASDDASASSAADTTTPPSDLMCLSPSTHPFNGTAELWTTDGVTVTKTVGFYWHGMPILQETDAGPVIPGPQWTVTARAADDTSFDAKNAAGDSVAIRLHGAPGLPNVLTGALTLVTEDGTSTGIDISIMTECKLVPTAIPTFPAPAGGTSP